MDTGGGKGPGEHFSSFLIENVIRRNTKQRAIAEEAIYAKYDLRRKIYPNIKFTNNKKFNEEIGIKEVAFITEKTKDICNILGTTET